MRWIFLLLALFFASSGSSQQPPYYEVDSLMRTFTKKIRKKDDLKDVFYFIYQNFHHDSTRFRACVVWISETISYDIRAANSEDPRGGNLDHVLRFRKAVCAGYALLLKELCDMFQIECEVITGNARSLNSDIHIKSSKLRSNHAWNKVKINDQWRLVDPTWISGYVTGELDDPKSRYVRSFSEAYYFTPPSKFVYNHFPQKFSDQFLSPGLTEKDYKHKPLYHGDFILDSISNVMPSEALIKSRVGDTIIFRLKTNGGVSRMMAWSEKKEGASFTADAKNIDGWVEFRYPVSQAGYYNLHIAYVFGINVKTLLSYKLDVKSRKDFL